MAKGPVKKKVAAKPAAAKAAKTGAAGTKVAETKAAGMKAAGMKAAGMKAGRLKSGADGAAARGDSKPGVKAVAAKKLSAKPGRKPEAKPEGRRAVATFQAAPAAQRVAHAPGAAVLDRLFGVIVDRRDADPTLSHSARLLSRGPAKVAQKFGEEAVECLIEAVRGDQAALVSESADALYHLVVMWVSAGITPEQVWAELQRREGVSGVEEKASRVPGETTKIP